MCTPENICVAALLELGGAGQVGQQLQGFPVDAVFAVVDVEVADGDVEFAAAVGVRVEEFTQVGAYDLVVVLAQRASMPSVAEMSGICSTAVMLQTLVRLTGPALKLR